VNGPARTTSQEEMPRTTKLAREKYNFESETHRKFVRSAWTA
jgi:hypothetical protein